MRVEHVQQSNQVGKALVNEHKNYAFTLSDQILNCLDSLLVNEETFECAPEPPVEDGKHWHKHFLVYATVHSFQLHFGAYFVQADDVAR